MISLVLTLADTFTVVSQLISLHFQSFVAHIFLEDVTRKLLSTYIVTLEDLCCLTTNLIT